MNSFYKRIIYKNAYLLIIAAWFYTLSFVVGNFFNYNNTPLQVKNTLEEYLAKQEKEFENITSNLDFFTKLVNPAADKGNLNLYKSPSGFFIYKMNKDSTLKQVFWSRYNMEVYPEELLHRDGYYFSNHTNGYYEFGKKTIRLDSNTFIAATLIPIKANYFFENDYVQNTFAADEDISKYYQIDFDSGIPIVNSHGKPLFNIDKIDEAATPVMSVWEGILKAIAIFFCMIFINYFIIDLLDKKGFKFGFALLLIVIIVVRTLSYFFAFPFYFRQFELFNPQIFASSALHPSLGAVIINALLMLWITKFVRYRYNFKDSFFKSEQHNKILSYACLVFFIIASFYIFSLVRTIVVDSRIPFNVVDFFDLNIYTIAGFFAIAVIILMYYNLSYVLLITTERTSISLWKKMLITIALSLIIMFLLPNTYTLYFRIFVIVWLAGYIVYMHYNIYYLESRLVRSPYFLFWVIFYTFSATFLMKEDDDYEEAKITNIVERLSARPFELEGNLFALSVEELNTNFLNNNNYTFDFKDSVLNNAIKDSVYKNNVSGYLSNFEVDFYTFDKNGDELYNVNDLSKQTLDTFIDSSTVNLETKNLYYYETDSTSGSFLYRKIIPAEDNSDTTYFYLHLKPRRKGDNDFYLTLLSPNNVLRNLFMQYHIGVYRNGKIIEESSQYDFPDTITTHNLPEGKLLSQINISGNKYWYKTSDNRVISIVKKNGFIYEFVALFSYLLLFTVLFILIISLLHFLIEARFKRKLILQRIQLSLRTQIYTSIIFVSLFSFVIIGGATISVYILNFEKDNQARLGRVITRFTKQIELDINSRFGTGLSTVSNEEINRAISDEVYKLATVSSENVNFYNNDGEILATSQPYVYNRKILSNFINPVAYNEMKVNNSKDFYHKESIGEFSYLSGYMPVILNDRRIGFLNVPFLNIQTSLTQNISSFITVIVSIIALVFMLAGILSMFLTQRILDSFAVIKDKMRKINLGEENEEIKWNKDDEIGDLLQEYNQMLRNLNTSASKLARSEREGAWSEMARQVAHEIKNPLTPMKLNLQFLIKMAESGQEISPDLTKRISESLIEQIDQLALIASDFSQFANITNVRLERFQLSEVLQKLTDMHSLNENIKIVYKQSGIDYVHLDKTQVSRLFSNLIKNAIEASGESENATIEIVSQNFGENVVVSIHDYGIGISKEQAAKIFVPNFTTKSSGTGLGLAISKVIVENGKGRIWFESIPNIGTTFYVSFPLHK